MAGKNIFNSRLIASVLALVLCVLSFSAAPAALGEGQAISITLSDSGIAADYPGVYAEGSVLTITLPGEYMLTGELSDGQIVVNCEQDGKVKLHFNGISVHCENAPALYVKKCSPRLSIELMEGSVNELSDGANHADSSLKGVLYSKSDVTITGTGALTVKGAYRDGIVSKDDLRIKNGKITVEAVHNGITGKDSVEIFDGEITVQAGNDGIKSTNEDEDWGYISIEGGTVNILCGDEPLAAVHGLFVTGGVIKARIDASLKASDD